MASAGALAAALDRCVAALGEVPRVLVGFSGGLDSTVLLHALAPRLRGRLAALHCNHGLHGDAGRWQQHCEAVCRALDVPLIIEALRIEERGEGTEAAARAARYAFFASQLNAGEVLLLAHHLDDQAETLLLRMLRGAGLEGLAAMPMRRALGASELWRPLLDLPRSALEDYARVQGLEWIEDPSNASLRHDRNYLRHTVMPTLEARWPGYRQTFGRAAAQLAEAAAERPAVDLGLCYSSCGDPGFSLAALPPAPAAAALALRAWLRARQLPMPAAARLTTFLDQLPHGERAELRTASWVLQRYRDAVYLRLPECEPPATPLPIVLGETLQVDGVGAITLHWTESAATGEDVAASPPADLNLRFRRGGERLRTEAGRVDLKTLFQDAAVPPWWRARLPLLYAGDRLIAVGDLRRAVPPLNPGLGLRWAPRLAGAAPGPAGD